MIARNHIANWFSLHSCEWQSIYISSEIQSVANHKLPKSSLLVTIMVLIQPIKPVSQIKSESASSPKPTLLSIAQRKTSEHRGEPEMSPLDLIRTRLKEQRNRSSDDETFPALDPNHLLSPLSASAKEQNHFTYNHDIEDSSPEKSVQMENMRQEEEDLIQI